MTPHRHWFTSYTPFKRSIRLADSKLIHSVGKGSVRFLPFINGKPQRLLEFHDVLHVPDLRSNLLSVLHLSQHKDYTVSIRKNSMSFSRNNTVLFTASVSNNCARLNGQIVPFSEYARLVSTCPLDSSLWHRQFCHLNKGDVHKLLSGALVSGITVKSKRDSMDPICESCLAGKQHRTAVPLIAQNRATKPLELVHSDLHGPLPVQSRNHYKYWIVFIDDFSRYWTVAPLKAKSDAFAAFVTFKAMAENQLNCKIKALRDDKGGVDCRIV